MLSLVGSLVAIGFDVLLLCRHHMGGVVRHCSAHRSFGALHDHHRRTLFVFCFVLFVELCCDCFIPSRLLLLLHVCLCRITSTITSAAASEIRPARPAKASTCVLLLLFLVCLHKIARINRPVATCCFAYCFYCLCSPNGEIMARTRSANAVRGCCSIIVFLCCRFVLGCELFVRVGTADAVSQC